jgi:hypothetical protein
VANRTILRVASVLPVVKGIISAAWGGSLKAEGFGMVNTLETKGKSLEDIERELVD